MLLIYNLIVPNDASIMHIVSIIVMLDFSIIMCIGSPCLV